MLPKKLKKAKKVRVMIDYANLKASGFAMNKHTDLQILFDYLTSLEYVSKVSIYYGTDPRNPKSYKFINWLRRTGYDVSTKDVKYIKIDIKELVSKGRNKKLLEKLDGDVVEKFLQSIESVEKTEAYLESPKCNLDIEIALDIFQSFETYDGYILFSGDGDFESIVKLARAEGKYIIVVALRKFLAGELIKNCDLFVNLKAFLSLEKFFYDIPEHSPEAVENNNLK